MTRQRLLRTGLILLALAIVVWLRVLPLWMPSLDARARALVRAEILLEMEPELGDAASRLAQQDPRIDTWIGEHDDEFSHRWLARSVALRDQRTFTHDGRSYTYLGDYDSYLWLRQARNVLTTGSICDAIVDGVCRNEMTHAPIGREVMYDRPVHARAIALLHRVVTLFRPGYPLEASAFLVPVVVGALGVFPAFFIGLRLSGALGGFLAALLPSIDPLFLSRSLGSDNDVWNLVLPLWTLWALLAALAARTLRGQIGYAAAAGVFVGLHAATWGGWKWFYAVFVAGLLLTLMARVGHSLATDSANRIGAVRGIAAALVSFYLVAGICVTTFRADTSYFDVPRAVAAAVVHRTVGRQHARNISAQRHVWPTNFGTVAELKRPAQRHPAYYATLVPAVLPAWLGLALLAAPRRRWNKRNAAAAGCGLALLLAAFAWPSITTAQLICVAAIAVGSGLALRGTEDQPTAGDAGAILLALLFCTSLLPAANSMRNISALVLPSGLVAAIAVGRLYELGCSALPERIGKRRLVHATVGVVAALLLLVEPARRAHTAAATFLPAMNDAWHEILGEIRASSPPQAIVNSWWDYGYWIAYVAERRVTADGASLRTRVPHFFARAMIDHDERRSAGLLRMLNCGSASDRFPQTKHSAMSRLTGQGIEPSAAYRLLLEMVALNRTQAEDLLLGNGVAEEAVGGILASSHCTPPPAYLILSSRWSGSNWYIGTWNFARAYAVRHAPTRPAEEVVGTLREEFGYSENAAQALYRTATTMLTPEAKHDFIGGSHSFAHPNWVPCDETDAGWSCRRVIARGGDQPIIEEVVFEPEQLEPTRLRTIRAGVRALPPTEQALGFVVRAAADELAPVPARPHQYPTIEVLIDTVDNRAMTGSPALIRSTYAHLLYLDGRYARYFEKIADAQVDGERVVAFRIRWEDLD